MSPAASNSKANSTDFRLRVTPGRNGTEFNGRDQCRTILTLYRQGEISTEVGHADELSARALTSVTINGDIPDR
jgi:hypothetical protein